MITEGFNGPNKIHATFTYRKNTADRNTILATFSEDEYHFTKYPAGKGEFMFDVGGYLGSTAILYALLNPKAKVIVFEPIPENVELIRTNIAQNKLGSRIKLIGKALWGKSGQRVRIYYRDATEFGGVHRFVGTAFKNQQQADSQNYVDVETTALKDIVDQFDIKKIRLVKLDCEGAEYAILKGLPHHIFMKIQTMTGEFHNPEMGNGEHAREKLFLLTQGEFENQSTGADTDTIGSFLFERKN
jgi:FkbM family methyltransferase